MVRAYVYNFRHNSSTEGLAVYVQTTGDFTHVNDLYMAALSLQLGLVY